VHNDHVENIYRLSSMQQGLLFHSLFDPEARFYVDQVVYTLHGQLDEGMLLAAWERAVERHAILRTSFHWEGLNELVQVVHTRAPVPVERRDWRDVPDAELPGRLDAYLHEDRSRGFEWEERPLFRLSLIRTGEKAHTFVFRYHHMLLDAWSALMLLEETFTRYGELVQGVDTPSGPVRSYQDYVAWLGRQDIAAAETFWREKLRGFVTPPVLPFERPTMQRSHDEIDVDRESLEEVLWLSEGTTEQLRGLARRHRVTLNTVMQAAWALLLSRYTDQMDIVFGTTASSRPSELDGVQQTLGLFINTLPLRIQLDPNEQFVALCERLQREQADLRSYDYSPLAQVQQWSDVEGGVPLFESIMTFLNVPGISTLSQHDGALQVRDGEYRYKTNYPISIMVVPDKRLSVRVGYDPARFSERTVARVVAHLEIALSAVACDPEVAVMDIPVLSPSERRELLVEWSGSSGPYSQDACVHELFRAQVERAPNAIAVVSEDQQLTYGELDSRANQLARHLRRLGVGPDTRVALCVERSPWFLVGLLAVLKAGGAYVPLDIAYPADRLAFMLADAQVVVLLTQSHLPQLSAEGIAVVQLDSDWADIARESTEPLSGEVRPHHPAYVIYTSGSTGRPKGTLVAHSGLCNVAAAQQLIFGVGPGDQVLQWASASFDASVFDVVMALCSGATLHLASQEQLMPGPGLVELLRRRSITLLTIPPSALAAVPAGAELPDLRTLILAGEALAAELVSRWIEGRRIFNAYGPTETTIWATVAECDGGAQPPPIGKPIQNIRTYVVDRQCSPTPVGVPGELCIGGVGVARGYLGLLELTAERFVSDPFSDDPAARMYRTGDRARWRNEGVLEFLGRIDRQVKVRGFRVEPAEIETLLHTHPAIDSAVVLADRDPSGEQRLVAYLVAAETLPPDRAIREFLAEKLPDHMLPAAFVRLDALPITLNGKLDQEALPSPEEMVAERARSARVAPRNQVEQTLTEIWRHVLGLDEIGVDDDFFELGGNSIKATQLASRVRQRFEVSLPLRAIFELKTVARCAEQVERLVRDELDALPEEQAEAIAAAVSVHASEPNGASQPESVTSN
jgi:amino acid adenylation domain-containing protein